MCKTMGMNERKVDNWIGHSWRGNLLTKRIIDEKKEGRIDVMGRRGRRGKQLLDNMRKENDAVN